jgi:Pyridoxamine 5'-phosphate oxidase
MTQWPDHLHEIVEGDHVVMLAYVTPAKGVVLLPLSNMGVNDREAGTVTLNSSVAAWRKLERMRNDPHVALAFHTREHSLTRRPEYILVQGKAKLSEPIPDYPDRFPQGWDRFERWPELGRLWRLWLRTWAIRVGIEVTAERILVWPNLECRGEPEVLGVPLPAGPPRSQRPPGKGTAPRINHARAARRAERLPDRLLGWVGADGFPFVVPVEVGPTEEQGIVLEAPPGLVPPGQRRAGLSAHWFSEGVVGQNQRKHTGWMDVGPEGRIIYAPHTQSNYRFPASRRLFLFVAGAGTRWWMRGARRAGIAPR